MFDIFSSRSWYQLAEMVQTISIKGCKVLQRSGQSLEFRRSLEGCPLMAGYWCSGCVNKCHFLACSPSLRAALCCLRCASLRRSSSDIAATCVENGTGWICLIHVRSETFVACRKHRTITGQYMSTIVVLIPLICQCTKQKMQTKEAKPGSAATHEISVCWTDFQDQQLPATCGVSRQSSSKRLEG